ncbi:phage/plasmid primase, P4 family [Elioraea rosea]|uniref:phage/plasmid primase, P4 family n=1 Tax=Elioraea rosea TaxID=2492390 RepID=UPI001EF4C87E|nr:phage/plasmid primase, P4 family [Elioraea rosea]
MSAVPFGSGGVLASASAEKPITYTRFVGFGAASKTEHTTTLGDLIVLIRATAAGEKADLPWLKLARFGEDRTEKGSLRHDANVLAITGIEADYDDEEIGVAQAVETLDRAGLLAILYTSPSHTAEKPRWRVLCPSSRELPPTERSRLVSRLNGAFGGIFAAESWTLSQAYYFGSVANNPTHQVVLVDGTPIDLRDDLDAGAIGKPATKQAGDAIAGTGPLDEEALLAAVARAESYHQATVRLAGLYASRGVPKHEAEKRLLDAMESVFPPDRDARWQERRDDIPRCVEDIYAKEEKARADAAEGLVTEDSVALAFARQHASELRFCHHTGKWFRWTGAIWQKDETQLGLCLARDLARTRGAAHDDKVRRSTGRSTFASGVERLAQADRTLAVTSEAWDRDPWLLATPGGTVDLRTGLRRDASPDDLITRTTAIPPAPVAECPSWLAFLDQATNGDADLVRFLQRWFGYCLTGQTREHALLFLYGPGGNGKGVLLNTVAGIMGTYATVAAMETFTASKGDKHPTDLAMLHGARLVISTETEEGRPWAEARIKALTGGDPVTARFMRRDFFTFTPAFKLNVSGNHKPALRNVDDAARRRFNVVPFVHKPPKPDPELPERLRAEWPAILRWMIEGCLKWQEIGLQQPKAVIDATAEYFLEQDLVAQWVDECCDRDVGIGDTNANLYGSWRSYAARRGEEARTAKWFGTTLERLGFERAKDCEHFRGRGFRGIRARLEPASPHWQDRDP